MQHTGHTAVRFAGQCRGLGAFAPEPQQVQPRDDCGLNWLGWGSSIPQVVTTRKGFF